MNKKIALYLTDTDGSETKKNLLKEFISKNKKVFEILFKTGLTTDVGEDNVFLAINELFQDISSNHTKIRVFDNLIEPLMKESLQKNNIAYNKVVGKTDFMLAQRIKIKRLYASIDYGYLNELKMCFNIENGKIEFRYVLDISNIKFLYLLIKCEVKDGALKILNSEFSYTNMESSNHEKQNLTLEDIDKLNILTYYFNKYNKALDINGYTPSVIERENALISVIKNSYNDYHNIMEKFKILDVLNYD